MLVLLPRRHRRCPKDMERANTPQIMKSMKEREPGKKITAQIKQGVTGRTSKIGDRSKEKGVRSDPFAMCKSLTCTDVSKIEKPSNLRKSIRERSTRDNIKHSTNCSVETHEKPRLFLSGNDSPPRLYSATNVGRLSTCKSPCHQSDVKVVARIRPLSTLESV